VLTVYGIETPVVKYIVFGSSKVATVLTVYGIETFKFSITSFSILVGCNSAYRLRY